MRKRTSMILFCTALLAIGLVFASTEAMADNEQFLEPQKSCEMTTFDGTPVGIQIDLTPVYQNEGNYVWEYIFSGIGSKSNQVTMLLPVCDPNIVFTGNPSPTILDPGEGDPTTDFGKRDFQYSVFRASAVLLGSGNGVQVISPVETATRATSLQLKSGNNLYYCRNMAAPACGGISNFSVPTGQDIVTQNGETFNVTFDKFSQCAKFVTCGGATCPEGPVPYADVPFGHADTFLKNLSAPGQACTSVVLEDSDPDGSTWYCSGGYCWKY